MWRVGKLIRGRLGSISSLEVSLVRLLVLGGWLLGTPPSMKSPRIIEFKIPMSSLPLLYRTIAPPMDKFGLEHRARSIYPDGLRVKSMKEGVRRNYKEAELAGEQSSHSKLYCITPFGHKYTG